MKQFEQLPHTADIQIRVYGNSIEQLFAHALEGMFQVIGPKAPGCVKNNDILECPSLPEKREIEITGALDIEILLVDFLSEALYLSDVHDEAYLKAEIHSINDNNIKATVHGIKVTGFEVVEIKAVTYHNLHIIKQNNHWQVDIVFDI